MIWPPGTAEALTGASAAFAFWLHLRQAAHLRRSGGDAWAIERSRHWVLQRLAEHGVLLALLGAATGAAAAGWQVQADGLLLGVAFIAVVSAVWVLQAAPQWLIARRLDARVALRDGLFWLGLALAVWGGALWGGAWAASGAWLAGLLARYWLLRGLEITAQPGCGRLENPAYRSLLAFLEVHGPRGSRLYGQDLEGADGRPVNAACGGAGPLTRVLIKGPIMERLDPSERCAVLAHELGHVRLLHHLRYYGLGALAGAVVLVAAEGWLLPADPSSAHWAALVVLLYGLLPVALFWMAPVATVLRRGYEREADDFAARCTAPGPAASALHRLGVDPSSRETFDPLVRPFRQWHPPLRERIARLSRAAPPM